MHYFRHLLPYAWATQAVSLRVTNGINQRDNCTCAWFESNEGFVGMIFEFDRLMHFATLLRTITQKNLLLVTRIHIINNMVVLNQIHQHYFEMNLCISVSSENRQSKPNLNGADTFGCIQ